MPSFFSLVFLVTLIAPLNLALEDNVHVGPRIINGTFASAEKTKHQVSVRLKNRESRFGAGHICGGSLIGNNKVLTAAHCLYDNDRRRYRRAREFVVVMGALNRFQRVNGTIVSDVTSIEHMGTFNMDDMRDDVGLLFLKTGLPANKTHLTVAPIALANMGTNSGAICQVTGWGETEKGVLPDKLLTADVPLQSRTTCFRSYGSKFRTGMICAGALAGGTDSCQGDSGGPLVYNNTLIGVVSWGQGCALRNYPGVYADVQYYNAWINSKNAGNSKARSSSIFCLVVCAALLKLFLVIQ